MSDTTVFQFDADLPQEVVDAIFNKTGPTAWEFEMIRKIRPMQMTVSGPDGDTLYSGWFYITECHTPKEQA